MPTVTDGDTRISSSSVRQALADGDLQRAQQLLARPYTISGRVIQGRKLGRSFGQAFLCPWNELEAFVAADGTSEESIVRAAERYQVSELLIASTLVNHGKIDRARLERFS